MIQIGVPRHPPQTLRPLLSSRARPVLLQQQGFSTFISGLGGSDDFPAGADECPLPETEFFEEDRSEADMMARFLDFALLVTPIVLPIVAGLSFEDIIRVFHETLERLADLKWVQVDGGLSRTAALLPVMTGIVLPCVSFALGTLTATTISTLRARQVGLRTTLNKEACLVRSHPKPHPALAELSTGGVTAALLPACSRHHPLPDPHPWPGDQPLTRRATRPNQVRNVLSATEAMFPAEHCEEERRRGYAAALAPLSPRAPQPSRPSALAPLSPRAPQPSRP